MVKRKIGKKTYNEFMRFKKKSDAIKTKTRLKKRVKGYGVRIIKKKDSYSVYVKK